MFLSFIPLMCYSARFCSAHCVKLCIFESDTCTLNHLPFRYASIFRVHYACVEIEGTFFLSLSRVSVISSLLQFSRLPLVFASYWCCTFALHPFKCVFVCVWIVGSILHAVLSTAFKCAFRFMPLLSTTHSLCVCRVKHHRYWSLHVKERWRIFVCECVCLFHIN